MKSIDATLLNHLGQPVTTTCLLVKVECVGPFEGQVYGFTSLDIDMEYDDLEGGGPLNYEADNGFTPMRFERSSAVAVDNTEVEGFIAETGITMAKVRAGLFKSAKYTVYRINWKDPTAGRHEVVDYGRAGETTFGRDSWRTEFLGLSTLLTQPLGETYGIDCNAQFGDARCGKALVWTPGTVTSVGTDTKAEFGDSSDAEAAGFYTLGVIRWTSGDNAGHQMEIEVHTTGSFELSLEMPYPIQVGDEYERRQDCDKKFETCRDVHANSPNFRGFNLMPLDGTPMVPGAEITRA